MDGPINVENGCGALFVSRLRTVSVVALGAFVAICSAQEYRVIDLGPMRPERRMAFVGGTGFENLVIAGHSDVNGVESPLLFSPQNNQVRWLSTLPQTRFALAYGVNSSGDAIGMNANLENGHADGHAIFWSHEGGVIDLGGGGAVAEGLNDAGMVVGIGPWIHSKPIGAPSYTHAFAWTRAEGFIDLTPDPTMDSHALAVNGLGQVVGTATRKNAATCGFVWSKTKGLLWLDAPGDASTVVPKAISNTGHIVGQLYLTDGRTAGIMWDPSGKPLRLGTAQSQMSDAMAINNHQAVVGYYGAGVLIGARWTQAKGLERLDKLVPPNSGWTFQAGTAIDDDGNIAGIGEFKGQPHGFLLVPVKADGK